MHYFANLAFRAHSCKVAFGSYPLLSWQQREGCLKGPDCEESSQLPSCCTPPLLFTFLHTKLQLCASLLLWFSGRRLRE